MEIKDRIHQVMESLNLSQQEFAARLEISPSSLSTIFTGRTNPTIKHVRAIHRAFPEVNVLWLQFGEGQMYTEASQESDAPTDLFAGSPLPDSPTSVEQTFSLDELETRNISSSGKPAVSSRSTAPSSSQPIAVTVFSEEAKQPEPPKVRIKEIRVFFEDGTYESFEPAR